MIDRLPKNGIIPKGHSLSLEFFYNQISDSLFFIYLDLSKVSQRIKDVLDYEQRRKYAKKINFAPEDHYLR